jgi:DNA repair exonuclease SbcCD ATPase subunit
MAVVGSMVVVAKADSTEWKKGMAEMRGEVDKTSKKAKSFFSDMKSSFGKSSTLGQSLKLIAGKGAIAAFTGVATELKSWAEDIGRIKQEMAEGKIDTAGMVDELARGAPIFGQWWSAGRAIHDLMSSDTQEIQKQNKELKAAADHWDEINKLIHDSKVEAAKAADEIQRLRGEVVVATASKDDKSLVSAKEKGASELAALKKQFLIDSKLIDKDTGGPGELEVARSQLKQLNAEVKNAKTNLDDAIKNPKKQLIVNEGQSMEVEDTSIAEAAQAKLEALTDAAAKKQESIRQMETNARQREAEFDEKRKLVVQKNAAEITATEKEEIEKRMRERRELELEGVKEIEEAKKESMKRVRDIERAMQDRRMNELEGVKDHLSESMKASEEFNKPFQQAQSRAVRGDIIAQYEPNVNGEVQRMHREQIAQLKSIDDSIKELRSQIQKQEIDQVLNIN